jgi:hypothetical protein
VANEIEIDNMFRDSWEIISPSDPNDAIDVKRECVKLVLQDLALTGKDWKKSELILADALSQGC